MTVIFSFAWVCIRIHHHVDGNADGVGATQEAEKWINPFP